MELVLDFRFTEERQAAQRELDRLGLFVACSQAFVGHELANTLGPLLSYVHMLTEQKDRLDDDGRMLLERVGDLAARADRWARRLADFGRLLRPSPAGPHLDPAEVAQESAVLVAARVAPLQIHLPGVLPPVPLARPLLQAVLIELFTNTAQAARADRLAVVCFDATPEPAGVWLNCRDNGDGMAESHLRFLQEPFTAARAEGAVGAGLGFFLVRQAAARWGGAIRVSSRPGEGTAIGLFVPGSLGDTRS